MGTLPVFVIEDNTGNETKKGIFSVDSEAVLQNIPIEELQKNLKAFCAELGQVLGSVQAVGSFRLKSVTVKVEVSAQGGFQLVGTASMGGKGAIEMTFSE
jgi:hypothetical protein